MTGLETIVEQILQEAQKEAEESKCTNRTKNVSNRHSFTMTV